MADTEPDPTGTSARLKRWLGWVARAVALVVVGVLAFRLLRDIDWGATLSSIGSLSGLTWVGLISVTLVRLAVEPLPHLAVLPGLSWWKGLLAYLAPAGAVSIIPGPADVAARYAMYRSWGVSTAATALAVSLSWIYTALGKAVLPIAAAVALFSIGRESVEAITTALIAGSIIVVAAVVLVLMLRSEAVAHRIGRTAGKAAHRLATRFRIQAPGTLADDLADKAVHFRDTAGELLRTRWMIGSVGAIAAQIALFATLLIAVRGAGVTPEQLPGAQVFAAFAFVQLITSVPVTPGGLGIAEASLVVLLVAGSSGGVADEITAAVLIYRAFSWLLLIPAGALAWIAWSTGFAGSKRPIRA